MTSAKRGAGWRWAGRGGGGRDGVEVGGTGRGGRFALTITDLKIDDAAREEKLFWNLIGRSVHCRCSSDVIILSLKLYWVQLRI